MKEKLRENILEYYWMTHYPNADYQEFEKTWLKSNDNEAFVDGLIKRFTKFIEQNSIDKDTHGRILKTSLDKIVELTKERDELKNQLSQAKDEGYLQGVRECESKEAKKWEEIQKKVYREGLKRAVEIIRFQITKQTIVKDVPLTIIKPTLNIIEDSIQQIQKELEEK